MSKIKRIQTEYKKQFITLKLLHETKYAYHISPFSGETFLPRYCMEHYTEKKYSYTCSLASSKTEFMVLCNSTVV
jgi:hypothetical protein